MNLGDEIDFGSITSKMLDDLIDANIAESKILNVRLSKRYEGRMLCGRIFDGQQLLFKKYYSGGYDHKLSAKMHYDWSNFLSLLATQRRGALRRSKGAEDAGMTIGEKIQQRPRTNQSIPRISKRNSDINYILLLFDYYLNPSRWLSIQP
ncbi:MAG TPA: hypothetical protein VF581_02540 [Flavobacterium sp.]|jgi:hypothetical protein